jgi:cytochrome c-type biogenesis protein CcmF
MWTALLAILTFSLSLLGTFLVRSGVITSVHAFATDPTRGIFILVFLAILIGGSLTLFAFRAPRASTGESFDTVSKDSMLLANNILLLVSAFTVLLGTLYPLILDAFSLGKISVGQPYFNAVFIPLMTPALFLMGVGPITKWRSAKAMDLAKQLRWALAISLVTSIFLPFVVRSWKPMIGFGLLMAIWIAVSTTQQFIQRIKLHPQGLMQGIKIQTMSYYGMLIAHLGVAVFVFGVTMVTGFEEEKDLRMQSGSTSEIAGYQIRFDSVEQVQGSNYTAAQGQLSIIKNGEVLTVMQPEKRKYYSSEMLMTEAAIYSKVSGDLYISMAEPVSSSEWGVKVQYKPFVSWIWGGAFLIALGGFLATLDKKYRKKPIALVKVAA